MSKVIIAVFTGLVGLIVGVNLSNEPQTIEFQNNTLQTKPESDKLFKEISTLQQQVKQISLLLEQEQADSDKNQKAISALKLEINELQSTKPTTEVAISDTSNETSENLSTINTTFNDSTPPQTTSKILASIGIDPVTAASIEQRNEQREMDQLYLRNEAIREGWFGTEKYFQKSRDLAQSSNVIREELGDDKYDEYLYSAGKFNRIKVSSVLAGSPANETGILAEDVILSYNDERVYNWSDLTTITANGKAGEMVEVSVLRDNAVTKFFIPRGPMGIRLESMRVNPSETSFN